MKTRILLIITLSLVFSAAVFAENALEELAQQTISENSAEAQNALKTLRANGQKGLDSMFAVFGKQINSYIQTGEKPENWKKISNAIDTVAMQKDAYSSRLFWHTNFAEAKAEAQKTGKPIISLRLLGNLNEEFSCANSRFFRSILYANPTISNNMREGFVLHWKSVRPAPKITIDFGDGRQIVRTITGNSIHYILDKDGKIVDALPGLYTPDSFSSYLDRTSVGIAIAQKNKNYLALYRNQNRNRLLYEWQKNLSDLEIEPIEISLNENAPPVTDEKSPPSALTAAPMAVTKSAVEIDTVRAISYSPEVLEKATTFDLWKKIAASQSDQGIDAASEKFIRRKISDADISESDFHSLIQNLNEYTKIDAVQNEYLFHTKIYQRLIADPSIDIESFNDQIYAELFLTPNSDKWLGLYSNGIYSAIDGNGVVN